MIKSTRVLGVPHCDAFGSSDGQLLDLLRKAKVQGKGASQAASSDTLRSMRAPRSDWDEFGVVEPYFAVLTEHRFLRENLTDDAIREFYATGERDLDRFLSLVENVRGSAFVPSNALDFGCGLGRITIPLARRCRRVVGVDVAPSMLEAAAKAASSQGVPNAEFLPVAELDQLVPGTFDFVVSHMVFQHIPPADAEVYVNRLLPLAAPGGAAVLHFSLRRPGGPVRRWLRVLRSRSRLVHRISCLLRRERPLPYMQMNEYDRFRIEALFANAGFVAPTVVETDHGGIAGGLFISTRRTAA